MVKRLNCSSTASPIERLHHQERRRLGDAHLAGRDRPRARALDPRVDVAVDDVVPGAAGAAHREGADEEQQRHARDLAPASRACTAASPADHQHGISSSQEPIGRSSRASRR